MWSILQRIFRIIMDALATNQLPKDANQDIPRVLYRGSTTVTTATTSGSWLTGTATITLSQIASSANNNVDVVIKDNQTGYIYFSPVQTTTGAGDFSITANHYLTGISSKLTLNIAVSKKGGASTDTYTVYYIVCSTSISSSISL